MVQRHERFDDTRVKKMQKEILEENYKRIRKVCKCMCFFNVYVKQWLS